MDHLSQRGQMESHLAHNQKRVSSILTAANFRLRSVVQQHDASLIWRKRWGGTTRSDFLSRAQRIGRPYTRLLIGEVPVQLRVSPDFSGLAEQHRHLFCKEAQTGAAPVAGIDNS